MKKITTSLLLLLVCSSLTQAQKKKNPPDYSYGKITQAEIDMKIYDKDTTANAVVLYEHGDTRFNVKSNRFIIQTTIYKKIKILTTDGFDYGTVTEYLYYNERAREELKNIKGHSYNQNGITTALEKSDVFETKVSDRYKKVSFAIPNVKVGTVIEYSYLIESPFYFNFTGWDFQDEIPKVESKFKATIPGNFVYNRWLKGFLKLSENHAGLKKNCFSVPGANGKSDCEVLTYAMKDIPAFIDEDYMTSSENYAASIKFEMSEYIGFFGDSKKYTTTWEAVDEDYRKDGDIGGQLKRKEFFKEQLPDSIRTELNLIERAKKIYYFIQNHYSWNEKYRLFEDMNVKRAYKEGVGTVGEINISLINALDASGITTDLVLASTRPHGFPTKTHPVITDFNYILARVELDGKIYYLDATEKELPFGVLPFRCLNGEVRVMDFENGSYWEEVKPIKNSANRIVMLLELSDDGTFEGNMRITNSGYSGISQRKQIKRKTEEKYLEDIENESDGFEIISYSNENVDKKEKTLREEFEIRIEHDDEVGDKIYLNPFFVDRITENPFKLDKREYPVDFGYPKKFDFTATITLPDGYEVETLPRGRRLVLPNKKGSFSYVTDYKNYKLRLVFKMSLDNYYFYTTEYPYLKELFNQMIETQNEPIVLRKI